MKWVDSWASGRRRVGKKADFGRVEGKRWQGKRRLWCEGCVKRLGGIVRRMKKKRERKRDVETVGGDRKTKKGRKKTNNRNFPPEHMNEEDTTCRDLPPTSLPEYPGPLSA